MRMIEKKMLDAIRAGRDWRQNNTEVVVQDRGAVVYLHGNNIGYWDYATDSFCTNTNTLARWPTPTTKSRLRALGVNVYTRDYTTYLDDEVL